MSNKRLVYKYLNVIRDLQIQGVYDPKIILRKLINAYTNVDASALSKLFTARSHTALEEEILQRINAEVELSNIIDYIDMKIRSNKINYNKNGDFHALLIAYLSYFPYVVDVKSLPADNSLVRSAWISARAYERAEIYDEVEALLATLARTPHDRDRLDEVKKNLEICELLFQATAFSEKLKNSILRFFIKEALLLHPNNFAKEYINKVLQTQEVDDVSLLRQLIQVFFPSISAETHTSVLENVRIKDPILKAEFIKKLLHKLTASVNTKDFCVKTFVVLLRQDEEKAVEFLRSHRHSITPPTFKACLRQFRKVYLKHTDNRDYIAGLLEHELERNLGAKLLAALNMQQPEKAERFLAKLIASGESAPNVNLLNFLGSIDLPTVELKNKAMELAVNAMLQADRVTKEHGEKLRDALLEAHTYDCSLNTLYPRILGESVSIRENSINELASVQPILVRAQKIIDAIIETLNSIEYGRMSANRKIYIEMLAKTIATNPDLKNDIFKYLFQVLKLRQRFVHNQKIPSNEYFLNECMRDLFSEMLKVDKTSMRDFSHFLAANLKTLPEVDRPTTIALLAKSDLILKNMDANDFNNVLLALKKSLLSRGDGEALDIYYDLAVNVKDNHNRFYQVILELVETGKYAYSTKLYDLVDQLPWQSKHDLLYRLRQTSNQNDLPSKALKFHLSSSIRVDLVAEKVVILDLVSTIEQYRKPRI